MNSSQNYGFGEMVYFNNYEVNKNGNFGSLQADGIVSCQKNSETKLISNHTLVNPLQTALFYGTKNISPVLKASSDDLRTIITDTEEDDFILSLTKQNGRGRPKKHITASQKKKAREAILQRYYKKKEARQFQFIDNYFRVKNENRRLHQQFKAIDQEAQYWLNNAELPETVKEYVILVKEINDFITKPKFQKK